MAAATLLVAGAMLGLWWHRREAPTAVAAPAYPSGGPVARDATVRPASWSTVNPASPNQREAGDDALCANQRRTQVRALRARMDPAASPDTAITRALLHPLATEPTGSGRSLMRDIVAARRLWPGNPDLAWLEARHCLRQSGCDERAASQRWQALEPENAAVWLAEMRRAEGEGDGDAWDIALARAAEADFHDPRNGLAFLHLRPALSELPLPASCERALAERSVGTGRALDMTDWADIEAQTAEVAAGMPSLTALRGCRPQHPGWTPPRRERCIALLDKISRGDTLLEQTGALPLLIPLVAGPEAMRLRERYRRLRWLTASIAQVDQIPSYIPRMWAEGEVAVLQQWQQQHGRWPPPADWLPEDERGRRLVLGDTPSQ